MDEELVYDSGGGFWRNCTNTELAEKFLELYYEVAEREGPLRSIFDMQFSCVTSNFAMELPETQASIDKQLLEINPDYNNVLFEANVLREFGGKEYVVKLKAEEKDDTYITLFTPRELYDNESCQWHPINETLEALDEIIKCYIKYINN